MVPGQPLNRRSQQTFYAQFELNPVRCIKQLDAHRRERQRANSAVTPRSSWYSKSEPRIEQGFDESTQRTVSENARNLEAQSSEFG